MRDHDRSLGVEYKLIARMPASIQKISLIVSDAERYCPAMKSHYFSRMLIVFLAAVFGFDESVMAKEYEALAIVKDPRINESSGLAISRNHPRCVWLHNDSGDKPVLFLVGYDGETKAVVNILTAKAIDWEDMCSFESDGQRWLLLADIGDNLEKRSAKKNVCQLYLVKEPVVPRANGLPTITWPIEATIQFEYEDGPHNCESIAVDTTRKEILLLTKKAPHKCGLYSLPLDLKDSKQELKAKRIASPFVLYATAIDVSPDNSTLAVCTMLNGLIVKRTPDQTWSEACGKSAKSINFPPRRQGETICFEANGKHLLLNSEMPQQPLYRMVVPD